MPEALNMPQVGQDLTHGDIICWRVEEGAAVKSGQVVAEVQSEKAAFEVEATADGILLKQLFKAGDSAEVLKPIAWIGQPGEAVPGADTGADADLLDEQVQTRAASAPVEPCAAPIRHGKLVASPSARRIARERQVDLGSVTGTGPGGRIIKRDVLSAPGGAAGGVSVAATTVRSAATIAVPPALDADQVLPFDRMRQIIADRLLASRQTIPDFTVVADLDMTPALAWRSAFNQGRSSKITINDLVLAAVAKALRAHPRLNSHVTQDRVVVKADINLGMAVAVEGGLLVPVIAAADRLDLEQLAAETRRLAGEARRGMVKPGAAGTFSVSNLGSGGCSRFFPIINPPECAILGVGAVEDRVVAIDGLMGVRKMLTLTLTADHRAVDGAYAAAFLATLSTHLRGF